MGVVWGGRRMSGEGGEQLVRVDDGVVWAGKEANRALQGELEAAGSAAQGIGGGDVAAELDGEREIDQGSRVAAAL